MPAPFGKFFPLFFFCLSDRASISELRRVWAWLTGLMRCGVSPGESRSSLKLPLCSRHCSTLTDAPLFLPKIHTHMHILEPHIIDTHYTSLSKYAFKSFLSNMHLYTFLRIQKHTHTNPFPIPPPSKPQASAQPLHGIGHVMRRAV